MLEKEQRDEAMSNVRTIPTVLITGASGNLGAKLRNHLQGRYELRLLDKDPRGDAAIVRADLSVWDSQWVEQFRGVDVVVHLATDPTAQQTWPNLLAPNVDAVVYAFQAAVKGGVRRFVYANSNHVLGGYSDDPEPARRGCGEVVPAEVGVFSGAGEASDVCQRPTSCWASKARNRSRG